MSLQRLAHRLATVAAIRGRTLAGQAVEDSAIPPIDTMAKDERKPFVSVYTDDQTRNWRGLDPAKPSDNLSIIIEIGVTAQMENDEEWGIPTTDAGLEITLDIIERQIKIALDHDGNAWAEMWRSLHSGDPEYKSIRGASADKGVRFAGRQMTIDVKPFAEPPYGPEATKLWANFLTLLAEDQQLATLAPAIRNLIEADAPPVSWQTTLRTLGLPRTEADAMLVTHIHNTGDQPIENTAVEAEPPA